MGRMLSCTWLRKGCELLPGHGRAQGWQILTLIQLQKLSGSQAAAMGPGRRCQGRNHFCSSCLHPLYLQRKTHYGASVFLLFGSPSCFPGLCWCILHWTHLGSHPCAPHTGRVGAAPPYPLCSPGRAQQGTRCLRTRFSFIPVGSWDFLPFSLALLQLAGCVASLWCFRICSGALGGFLIGRAMDS